MIWIPGVEYGTSEENWQTEYVTGIDRAVAAAAHADVIIACVGENSYCETPGNINDLNLSSNQQQLVRALTVTGKPMILILNEGRPRLVREIEPLVQAIVDMPWLHTTSNPVNRWDPWRANTITTP